MQHAFFSRQVSAVSRLFSFLMITTMTTSVAQAEFQLGVYGGANFAPHSTVTINEPGLVSSNRVGWSGKPFQAPPYWGLRGTYWLPKGSGILSPAWGIAIDYTHAKVYADLGGDTGTVYSHLEFTDGLNLLTANLMYRHQTDSAFTPYAGFGVGLSIPHVEVTTLANPGQPTFDYQLAGVSVQGIVGLEWAFSPDWSLFGEYKMNYATVDADLATGGTLETSVLTNHVSFGISYKF